MLEENSIIPDELLESEEAIVVIMSNELSEQQIRVIVRDEYATYQSNIGMILTITSVIFLVLALAIPVMSYVFIQKDHVQALRAMMDEAEIKLAEQKTEVNELIEKFEEQSKELKHHEECFIKMLEGFKSVGEAVASNLNLSFVMGDSFARSQIHLY